MKRLFAILVVLMLVSMACSFSGNEPEAQPAAQSENRCGDGVCDGPENTAKCPADCPAAGDIAGGVDTDNETDTTPEEQSTSTESSEEAQPENGYRYVSFGGTIITTLNTALMGDFTGIAFEYSGDYQIELWFPLAGGEALQQRNTIVLTEFKDLYFDSSPCVWELNESAFEPVSFELETSLNLNGIQEGGQPADELVYQLVTVPQAVIGGVVQCEGSPGDFSDPAAYPILTTWFMQGFANPIHLNAIENNTVERQPAGPTYFVDIPRETLSYIIVPDLNTP